MKWKKYYTRQFKYLSKRPWASPLVQEWLKTWARIIDTSNARILAPVLRKTWARIMRKWTCGRFEQDLGQMNCGWNEKNTIKDCSNTWSRRLGQGVLSKNWSRLEQESCASRLVADLSKIWARWIADQTGNYSTRLFQYFSKRPWASRLVQEWLKTWARIIGTSNASVLATELRKTWARILRQIWARFEKWKITSQDCFNTWA